MNFELFEMFEQSRIHCIKKGMYSLQALVLLFCREFLFLRHDLPAKPAAAATNSCVHDFL